MVELIIGSVYSGNWSWYPIQKKFISTTTENYEWWICSHETPPENQEYWIGKKKPDALTQELGRYYIPITVDHIEGLRTLYEKFKNSTADYCLILDSDAFPIKKNWLPFLIEKLEIYGKRYAAPIRCENGDMFPHVSFVFFNKNQLEHLMPLIWNPNQQSRNLLNIRHVDAGSNLPIADVFPLLKSNRYSPHPLFHNIYYDLAYHAGCGSRQKDMYFLEYWNHIREISQSNIPEINENFIAKLVGNSYFL